MIVDQIKCIDRYASLNDKVKYALNFLKNIGEIASHDPGEYYIDGHELYYIINDYETTTIDKGIFEYHYKYIDIHAVILGSELIGYADCENKRKINKYDSKKDFGLYENKGELSLFNLRPGFFAIFFPGELHMTGVSNIPVKLKKIVRLCYH